MSSDGQLDRQNADPAEEDARELLWLAPRPEDPRVTRIGTGRGGVEFEFCSQGGAYFIRRTKWASASKKAVHETPRATFAQADADWFDLLGGRAR